MGAHAATQAGPGGLYAHTVWCDECDFRTSASTRADAEQLAVAHNATEHPEPFEDEA